MMKLEVENFIKVDWELIESECKFRKIYSDAMIKLEELDKVGTLSVIALFEALNRSKIAKKKNRKRKKIT